MLGCLRVTAILSRFANLIWFLITWFLLVAVICAVLGGFYLYHRADESLRSHIENKLQGEYRDLDISIQSARLIERRGFEINGLSIAEPHAETPLDQLATVDRVLVRCNPRLEDLLRGEISLTEVVFQNPVIRGSRKSDGSWSLRPLAKLPRLSDLEPPRVRIENGVIELVDTTVQPSRLLIFRNFNATLIPQSQDPDAVCPPAEFVASFTSDYAHQVSFTGKVNPCSHQWELAGETRGLTISPGLLASLPSELSDSLSAVAGLQTQVQLQFSASHNPHRTVATEFLVTGRATRGRLDDPRLPSPLTGLSAQLVWNNRSIQISDVRGRMGGAPLEFDYVRDDQQESIVGSVRGLQVDRNTPNGWSSRWQELWNAFQPTGTMSASLALKRPVATDPSITPRAATIPWHTDLRADCHQMSFLWERVPYPLRAQAGTISYQGNRLTVDLRSTDPGRAVQIQGEVFQPGPRWTGWLVGTAPTPLKIDDSMLEAISEPTRSVLRQFNLRGDVRGTWRVERDQPRTQPHHTVSVQLMNGEVQHAKFPYPIRQVTGHIERKGPHWRFLDLVGRNDNGVITCEGELKPTATAKQLALRFVATSIPLEAELRQALPTTAQQVWNQLQPQGVIDHVAATYTWDADTNQRAIDIQLQNRPHRTRTQGQALSVHAQSFPYTIHDVVGTVTYRNGEIRMERMRGHHGDVTVAASGRARIINERWELNFDQLSADRVQPRRELLAAMPRSIRAFVERTQFSGPAAVQGRLMLSGQTDRPGEARASWDLDVDIDNGALVLAAEPIHQIAGAVRLRGSAVGDAFECHGEMNCDSAICRGVQITNVRGPIWVDPNRVLLGRWATTTDTEVQPSLVGEVFDGVFECDAQLLDSQFDVQARLANMDVGRIVRDLARRPYNVRGLLTGGIAVSGSPGGAHTLRGTGAVTVRDTDLYELPVILSLLNTLSTGSTDRTAFTSSDMAFKIKGDRVYFDQLDLRGPALTLKGVGDVGFDRDLSLDFYSLVGREESYLPAVRSVLGLASRRFMRVNVTGTLDDPQMTREMLPGINQTLQQLFPEAVEPSARVSNK